MESTELKLRCLYCWSENSGYRPRCYSCNGPLVAVSPARTVCLLASIAIVIGFADLPYGYYSLLRLALCGAGLFLLVGARLSLEDWHRWTLGILAVLYNPILPIRIGEKGIWEILNVATVIFFWTLTRKPR